MMGLRMYRSLAWFAVLAVGLLSVPAALAWWREPIALCTLCQSEDGIAMVSDGHGGAIVAWSDLRNGTDFNIYAQHVLASGLVDPAWPADGRALCMAQGHQRLCEIVSDGDRGAIVVWDDARVEEGPFEPSHRSYAQHVLASGEVDPAWPADGREVLPKANDHIAPWIVSDGSAGVIVVGGYPNTDQLRVQHVLASGELDSLWPADGLLVCDYGGTRFVSLPIASDGAGGAILTWGVSCDGTVYSARVQHVLASGGLDPDWPTGGRVLCTLPSWPYVIESDGTGGAIAAWGDGRNGTDADIYGQHVLATGSVDPVWPTDGSPLSTGPGYQYPQIRTTMSDDAGGAILVWSNQDTFGERNIYAQHVLASGAVAWGAPGQQVSTPGSSLFPSIASDHAGGVIVAWEHIRTGFPISLHVHHVLASGALDPAWPTDGRLLSASNGEQAPPGVVSDGAGGAIIGWHSEMNGLVYAQHVHSDGTVDAVESQLSREIDLWPPTPNPFSTHANIRFAVRGGTRARIGVYDVSGRMVQELWDAEVPPGERAVAWDGRAASGRPAPSGVYLLRLVVGSQSLVRRLVLSR